MSHEQIKVICGTGSGCCSDDALIIRRYATKAEKLEELQSYKEQLEKELAGVMERIKELS